MPFMEDAMLDLFGEDANTIDASLPAVDDLELMSATPPLDHPKPHRLGPAQQLAWSKAGAIARLDLDGRKIHIFTLMRNPRSGIWSLRKRPGDYISAPSESPFVHIEWSSAGLDLVAFDQVGRPVIYSISYALERLKPQTLQARGQFSTATAVVGALWLRLYPIHAKVCIQNIPCTLSQA